MTSDTARRLAREHAMDLIGHVLLVLALLLITVGGTIALWYEVGPWALALPLGIPAYFGIVWCIAIVSIKIEDGFRSARDKWDRQNGGSE